MKYFFIFFLLLGIKPLNSTKEKEGKNNHQYQQETHQEENYEEKNLPLFFSSLSDFYKNYQQESFYKKSTCKKKPHIFFFDPLVLKKNPEGFDFYFFLLKHHETIIVSKRSLWSIFLSLGLLMAIKYKKEKKFLSFLKNYFLQQKNNNNNLKESFLFEELVIFFTKKPFGFQRYEVMKKLKEHRKLLDKGNIFYKKFHFPNNVLLVKKRNKKKNLL